MNVNSYCVNSSRRTVILRCILLFVLGLVHDVAEWLALFEPFYILLSEILLFTSVHNTYQQTHVELNIDIPDSTTRTIPTKRQHNGELASSRTTTLQRTKVVREGRNPRRSDNMFELSEYRANKH